MNENREITAEARQRVSQKTVTCLIQRADGKRGRSEHGFQDVNGNSAGIVHEGLDRRKAGSAANVQKVRNPVFVRVVEYQSATAGDAVLLAQNADFLIGSAVNAVREQVSFREPLGLINPAFRVERVATLVESVPLDPVKDVQTEIDVERVAIGTEQAGFVLIGILGNHQIARPVHAGIEMRKYASQMLFVVPVPVGFRKVRDVAAEKQEHGDAVDVEADGIGKVVSLLQ